jgi:hypothetical protein
MANKLTYKDVCRLTGRSLAWLKAHQCAWCDQDALYAVKYGCGSIYGPRCDTAERFKQKKDIEHRSGAG